jgi:hypothetical protein
MRCSIPEGGTYGGTAGGGRSVGFLGTIRCRRATPWYSPWAREVESGAPSDYRASGITASHPFAQNAKEWGALILDAG